MLGIPTCECPYCECRWMICKVMFDPEDYTIGMYATTMECMGCGALLTAPTPLDLPGESVYDGGDHDADV